MDPLHPIIPTAPPIRPVAPSPGARATSRDAGRGAGGGGEQRRRRAGNEPPAQDTEGELAPAVEGEDDHPHIDVIA
jgi:hypothetical protein